MSKFETTEERRANLVKLARFLWVLPQCKFSMGLFSDHGDDGPRGAAHTCPAVGCAVGWGPAAGIEPLCTDRDWYAYADRVFGDDGLHDWCFHSGWALSDETPKGAAKRILWALLNGIPEKYIEDGEADDEGWREPYFSPGCYADWEPTEEDWTLAATAEQGATS
jgi:hypothetical protein